MFRRTQSGMMRSRIMQHHQIRLSTFLLFISCCDTCSPYEGLSYLSASHDLACCMAILSHLLFGIRGPERKVGHQYVKSVAACAIEMGSGSVEKSYKSWITLEMMRRRVGMSYLGFGVKRLFCFENSGKAKSLQALFWHKL